MFQHDYASGEGKIYFDETVGSHNVASVIGESESFNWTYDTEGNAVNLWFDSSFYDGEIPDLLEEITPRVVSGYVNIRFENGNVGRYIFKDWEFVCERGDVIYEEELERIERVKSALCEFLEGVRFVGGDKSMIESALGAGLGGGDLDYLGL